MSSGSMANQAASIRITSEGRSATRRTRPADGGHSTLTTVAPRRTSIRIRGSECAGFSSVTGMNRGASIGGGGSALGCGVHPSRLGFTLRFHSPTAQQVRVQRARHCHRRRRDPRLPAGRDRLSFELSAVLTPPASFDYDSVHVSASSISRHVCSYPAASAGRWVCQPLATRMPGAPSHWSAGKDLSWEPLRIERPCEVKYDHMQGNRFSHAAQFMRWRPDKPPEACRHDQLEVIKPLRARADIQCGLSTTLVQPLSRASKCR
jgi:hypothetical protein